jgi:Flp pilus assembly protein TadG
VELTLVGAPVIVLLLVLLVVCGRVVQAELRVTDAAYQAARAASLERTPGQATLAARATAQAALDPGGASCTDLAVTVDTGSFVPGGVVRVTVTCRVDLRGLSGLAVPGSTTRTATRASPIDTYRSAPAQAADDLAWGQSPIRGSWRIQPPAAQSVRE